VEGVEGTSVHVASAASSEYMETKFAGTGRMRNGIVDWMFADTDNGWPGSVPGKDCVETEAGEGDGDCVAKEGDGIAARSQGSNNAIGDW